MNNLPDEKDGHPTEEQLMELAINGGKPEHLKHLDICDKCARAVREFRDVSRRVTSMEEEEVPRHLERRIMGTARHGASRHGTAPGLVSGVQALLANPFLLAVAVALVVILLYFLVGTEVFREP
ncbi:MAG: hypothetical protein JXA71_09105 [Chitinispirillaceae bacterium]|nr:hypothetical protein [Chitinispirillaceae bacterium]